MTTATEETKTENQAEENKETKPKAPKDYSGYLSKERTDAQNHFADWVCDKTGLDESTADEKYDNALEAFKDGIRLGKALVMDHQASPENQAEQAARRQRTADEAARKREAAEARRQKKEEEKAAQKAADEKAKAEGKEPAPKATAKSKKAETKASEEAPF